MEGICVGKCIVAGIYLKLDYLNTEQEVVVCTIKLQKKKEVSAILLYGTLQIN